MYNNEQADLYTAIKFCLYFKQSMMSQISFILTYHFMIIAKKSCAG